MIGDLQTESLDGGADTDTCHTPSPDTTRLNCELDG